jgi:hypothetical protein
MEGEKRSILHRHRVLKGNNIQKAVIPLFFINYSYNNLVRSSKHFKIFFIHVGPQPVDLINIVFHIALENDNLSIN